MPKKPPKSSVATPLSDLLTSDAKDLLTGKGSDFVRKIGLEVVRGVVLDVLVGKNLRDSTELLTRRRVATLNLAMLNLFLKGSAESDNFVTQLPYLATDLLNRKQLPKSERWLAQWILGLTDKSFQNVLRDNRDSLSAYRDRYIETCQEVIANHTRENGELLGILKMDSHVQSQINWLWVTYLFNTIGAQTLAIRGSEKSAYGKLFEKLILGSLLHILGFRQVLEEQPGEGIFWLSSRGERRESDATLLYKLGQGVRFDIGFIGRGNPEISLDKVSRFERQIELGGSRYYLATIIIVDRIGKNSRIVELAQQIKGTIIQMSANYWPQQIASILSETLGFEHELTTMPEDQIESYLKTKLEQVPVEDFIGQIQVEELIEVSEPSTEGVDTTEEEI